MEALIKSCNKTPTSHCSKEIVQKLSTCKTWRNPESCRRERDKIIESATSCIRNDPRSYGCVDGALSLVETHFRKEFPIIKDKVIYLGVNGVVKDYLTPSSASRALDAVSRIIAPVAPPRGPPPNSSRAPPESYKVPEYVLPN